MSKKIERVVYRSLRKAGFRREQIHLQSKFNDDLDFEGNDWLCFTFFLENQINKDLNDIEIRKMINVKQLITHLNSTFSLS
jgi:acyl carrier protein